MQATSVVNAYSSQSANAVYTPLVGMPRRDGTSSSTGRSTAWKVPQQGQADPSPSTSTAVKGDLLLQSDPTFFFQFSEIDSPTYFRDAISAYQAQSELGVPQRAIAAPRPDAPPPNPVPDKSPQVYGDPSAPIPMARMTPGVLVDTYA